MTVKIKKWVITLVVLILSLNFTVSAKDAVSLEVPKDFCVYSKEPQKTAEILGMTETELKEYCVNGSVLYLAVDKDNSRQIRVTVGDTAFSSSVVNISELTDDKIESLAPEISGFDGVKGEAVSLNGQKFLKVELQSEDDGGEYFLTQYITVAEKQNIVLSFYTDSDADTDYIEDTFATFSCPMFVNEKDEEKVSILLVIVPIVVVGFVIACIGIIVSLVLDVKKNGNDEEDFIDDTDSVGGEDLNTEESEAPQSENESEEAW